MNRTLPSQSFGQENILFGLATCVLIVVAHAIAYMTHEYAHSFMAWALGWRPRQLTLDYGHPTLMSGYVPIRAITSHADIAIAAKGFGVSTWVLFPSVIVPRCMSHTTSSGSSFQGA